MRKKIIDQEIQGVIDALKDFATRDEIDRNKEFQVEEYASKETNAIILNKAISDLLHGEAKFIPFTPYKIQHSDNFLFIFSFIDYAKINSELIYEHNFKNYKIGEEKGRSRKKLALKTDTGIVNLFLYLTVFPAKELNKSIKNFDSIIVDSLKSSDFRDLEFELIEHWSVKNKISLNSYDYLTRQCNEKTFFAWFKNLKSDDEKRVSDPVCDKLIEKFIKNNGEKLIA